MFRARLAHVPFWLVVAFAFSWLVGPAQPLGVLWPEGDLGHAHSLLLAAFFLLLVLLHRRADALFARRGALVGFCSCGMVGALIAIAVEATGSGGAAGARVAAGCLMALFQTFAIIACLKALSRFDMVDALLSLMAWQLCISLVRLACSVLPTYALELLAPAVVLFCLIRHRTAAASASRGEAPVEGERESGALPVRLMAINALVVFVIYAISSFVPQGALTFSPVGTLLAVVTMALVLIASGKLVRMRQLYRTSLVLFVIAIVFLAVGAPPTDVCSAMFADAAYVAFSVFFFTVLCNICLRYHVNQTLVFASAYLVECLAATLGGFLSLLVDLVPVSPSLLPVVLIALMVVAFTCFSTDEDYRTAWGTSRVKKGFVDPTSYYYSLVELCSSIAMQYALSKRESDVLLLLAQKKTASEIAAELVVSTATVKTHVHNIYRKLDIHSRQELFEFVGCLQPRDGGSLA